MAKATIDLGRLEMLIRGAEPESIGEIAFVRCYVGTIVNEPIYEIAQELREKIELDKLEKLDWKYLFLGLVMGDKDFRDTIKEKDSGTLH